MGVVHDHGVNAFVDIINRSMKLDKAMKNASVLIEQTAENVMRILQLKITNKMGK